MHMNICIYIYIYTYAYKHIYHTCMTLWPMASWLYVYIEHYHASKGLGVLFSGFIFMCSEMPSGEMRNRSEFPFVRGGVRSLQMDMLKEDRMSPSNKYTVVKRPHVGLSDI